MRIQKCVRVHEREIEEGGKRGEGEGGRVNEREMRESEGRGGGEKGGEKIRFDNWHLNSRVCGSQKTVGIGDSLVFN